MVYIKKSNRCAAMWMKGLTSTCNVPTGTFSTSEAYAASLYGCDNSNTLFDPSLFRPSEYLTKLKAAAPAVFGASWWPYANYQDLRVATYLSIWVRPTGHFLFGKSRLYCLSV